VPLSQSSRTVATRRMRTMGSGLPGRSLPTGRDQQALEAPAMRVCMPGENGQPAVGNAGFDAERVSTAALLAAMELIRGMSDNPAAIPGDQLMEDIEQAEIRPEELTQAFATLLYGFLHVFNDADVDMIVGSVTRRLRRLQLVPEVMVTRMRGAMRAAAAGQSPLRWRERFGPMPPDEALAWAYTTWLLADLLDYLGQERGQRDRFSDRIVQMLLTVDPDQDSEV
jgi:hypothetical protein